jgi:hypothetical protein
MVTPDERDKAEFVEIEDSEVAWPSAQTSPPR